MYFSRVELDDLNRQKLQALTHLGAYHGWVESCFADEIKHHERKRHLWRLDRLGNKRYLLLVSATKPDLTTLAKYGVNNTAQTKDYTSFLTRLREGQTLRFRLAANPVKRAWRDADVKGKICAHVTVAQQKQWLLDRAERNGFKLCERQPMTTAANSEQAYAFDVVARKRPLLKRRGSKNVHLSCVEYEGMLTITDLALFKHALTHGIGREKAYGMGLLTVIPVD